VALAVTGVIAASDDDEDRYESLHWRAVEEWLDAHPHDPASAGMRDEHARSRQHSLRTQRELPGSAIFVGRKDQGADAAL
jgi:hypothetical protein